MILTDTALEQLAKAATPGPWETDYDIERSPNLWIVAPSAQEAALCKFETWDLGENKHGQLSQKDFADAAFIAAFNPAVALDLLTRLRAAERERDEIKKLLSDAAQVLYKNTSPETQLVERLGDCITQLRARAEAAEKERDEAWNAGRDAAAEVLRKAWVNYDAEFGSTDYETGTCEYPGNGDEMMNEWQELEEEIRALKRKQEPS